AGRQRSTLARRGSPPYQHIEPIGPYVEARRMSGPLVTLDFVAPHGRTSSAGVILLMLGLIALGTAGFEYYSLSLQRAGLQYRLEAALRQSRPDPRGDERTARANVAAAGVATALGAPWTAMLEDLELASRDTQGQIAILAVEPDHEKHR